MSCPTNPVLDGRVLAGKGLQCRRKVGEAGWAGKGNQLQLCTQQREKKEEKGQSEIRSERTAKTFQAHCSSQQSILFLLIGCAAWPAKQCGEELFDLPSCRLFMVVTLYEGYYRYLAFFSSLVASLNSHFIFDRPSCSCLLSCRLCPSWTPYYLHHPLPSSNFP
jgi:hypothetical protein